MKMEEIVNKFNLQKFNPCGTTIEPGYLKLEDDDKLLEIPNIEKQ